MFPTKFGSGLSGTEPQQRVGSAIAMAAAKTGVDFGYLISQAKIESGFNATARARTSSATGLYQFVEQTWLATVKEHGGGHGLDWAANAIHQGSNGRYYVADAGTREAILDLRNQPEAAAAMAAEYASDNRAYLEERLGRPAESVDLYLAHFLGPAGAAKFLSAHDADPSMAGAGIVPAAARANRSIFYTKSGQPRSVSEIRERFAAKMGGATGTAVPSLPTGLDTGSFKPTRLANQEQDMEPIARPSAHYARMAYLMLADLGA